MIESGVVEHINTLVDFCALRDADALTREVDVAILFGGSILAGGDVFARVVASGRARRSMIVGGQGHSSDVLREAARRSLGWDDAGELSEAALFERYLLQRYDLSVDRLEHESTNCGSNVRNSLAVLAAAGFPHERVLIIQDGSMQRRMDAGFRLLAPEVEVVNFAAHRTHLELVDGELGYLSPPAGMWPPDRYLSLLMGEIPRLTDGPEGYGPSGRGFIAHVDVPAEVSRAWSALRAAGVGSPRLADQRWADA
ncbi:YdcF family protein [Actinoplanes sp. M2I2]|uniref:YdcF family protein n=1 Tax=Actinoplanes sp. M2I2 TaxID=1734444 RepID=UPI00202202F9|nr:YdcF family protein [Actinoplanes sp. M2I2]